MPNTLYFGDNLHVLRQYVKDESVDLVYLDPPFNSNAQYNKFFKSPTGAHSTAQWKAFLDSWHWGEEAELAYSETLRSGTGAAGILRALRSFLGDSDMMAYLAMMSVRLIELRRALKPTGSLYLHCDPTASHYLKIILDSIFGMKNFQNEIIWRRTRAHNDRKITKLGAVHDSILCFSKTEDRIFNVKYMNRDATAPKSHDIYKHSDGIIYRKGDCRAPGNRGPLYEWNGYTFNWRFSPQERDRLIADGRIVYTKTGMPRVLRDLDPEKGSPLQDVWTDIDPVNAGSTEILGYPTQKPVTLLERILSIGSNAGDVVLDPFCGCGTAMHAAQKMNRSWIGIDITHIAIQIIEDRLRKYFPMEKPKIVGRPADLAGAEDMARRDKHEFQSWAVWLAGGWPVGGVEKKGMDRGVDGEFYFKRSASLEGRGIVSVKGGQHIGPQMIRDLKGTMAREGADVGVFVCLVEPTAEMRREAASGGFIDDTDESPIPRVQIRTIAEMMTSAPQHRLIKYDTVTAAAAGRNAARVRFPKAPTREDLHRQPQMSLPIAGGKTQQVSLALYEPEQEKYKAPRSKRTKAS